MQVIRVCVEYSSRNAWSTTCNERETHMLGQGTKHTKLNMASVVNAFDGLMVDRSEGQ